MYAGIMKGNTARLRQLIKEFGLIWMTEKLSPQPMQCFDNQLGYAIVSEDGKHSRNIQVENFHVPI